VTTKMKKIELTPEDWQRADEELARDPREAMRERFAMSQARERVMRDERERRRRRLNRLSLGLLGRR
jgi:hypothetical protein